MRYDCKKLDWEYLSQYSPLKRDSGNRGVTHTAYYLNALCAFDIETSVIQVDNKPESIMYVWQFAIEGDVFFGRTWEDYVEFSHVLSEYANASGCCVLVFVHNLSYEWQWLRALFKFKADDVFLVKSRKVLKARCGAIEYRCSYLLTNMSLGEFTSKMMVEHVKKSGDDYNYGTVRYPWTDLTEEELMYCENDVLGLIEAVHVLMDTDGDNLYTLPYTSTGYVRRDVKNALSRPDIRSRIEEILPDAETYKMCRDAFRGGNTHANRYFAGQILSGVKSYDRSSSYPDTQINEKYPITRFLQIEIRTEEELERLIYRRGKATLVRLLFVNLHLSDPEWPVPYISRDKSRGVIDGVYDNGRVLEAAALIVTVTDVDYRIIREEYEWDKLIVLKCLISTYGEMPDEMCSVIKEYYNKKTALKDVEGEEVYYTKSKNKLNSIYGLSAQNPVKNTIKYENGEYVEVKVEDGDLNSELERTKKRQIMPYQWGVWVTAWARHHLEEGIRLAGHNLVYVDTDSVKAIGEVDFDGYNNERIRNSGRNGALAKDCHGVIHYMGVYEYEGEYDEFITWGAKKYAYRKRGKLGITVSGVNKKKGAIELEERGGLESFLPDFTFTMGGGVEVIYNDHETVSIQIEGREVKLTSNVAIVQSTYTLGITDEYQNLLEICKKTIDSKSKS